MRVSNQIILIVVVSSAALSSIIWFPILGFIISGWQVNHIVNVVGEEELVRRTKDLAEVKAFTAKYNATFSYLNLDFHVGVVYAVTECELTHKHCGISQPYAAYLEVLMDEWYGYPGGIKFACLGDAGITKYPLNSPVMLDMMANCF